MTSTPHLGLPLIAAAQAQKHVTHNEALVQLDALVQASVKERNKTSPPPTPQEGDAYLVGASATGSFLGQSHKIALFASGWTFLVPQAGWRVYVISEALMLVFNGAAWVPLGSAIGEIGNLSSLGIGTSPDAVNALAAKLNAALFTAKSVAESGTGDLRLVFNKENASKSLSQLYQSNYSGRAETGLTGDDDYRIRVSSDGAQWRDALRFDRSSGEAFFPAGAQGLAGGFRNLLLNANFDINQRGFAGGALAAGLYGFDRWKGGAGGCTLTRASDGTITLNGALVQVIENPDLASTIVTLSVESPSASLSVDVAGVTGTITAGVGRRGVTLNLSSITGHVSVAISGNGTFKKPVLNKGSIFCSPDPLPFGLQLALCQRYYAKTFNYKVVPASNAGQGGALISLSMGTAVNSVASTWRFPVVMRGVPTLSTYNPSGSGSGFYTSSGAISASSVAGESGCFINNNATTQQVLHFIHAVAEAEL